MAMTIIIMSRILQYHSECRRGKEDAVCPKHHHRGAKEHVETIHRLLPSVQDIRCQFVSLVNLRKLSLEPSANVIISEMIRRWRTSEKKNANLKLGRSSSGW